MTSPVPVSVAKALGSAGLLATVADLKHALVAVGAAAFLTFTIGMSTVLISMQPTFCISCHEIRPAFDQWLTSSHSGMICLDCHTEPGLPSYIKVNVVGAQHLVTHLTADYGIPAHADVQDESCLSCHPRESLSESSIRTTLRVAHSKHAGQLCADCHGRLVHVNATAQLATAPKPHAVRDCTVCHTPDNCPHGSAALACTSCHSGMVPGHQAARDRGAMPRESCQECHRVNRVGSPEYCQTCHISPHGVSVPCSRCHTSQTTWTEHTFKHPVPLVGEHAGLDCGKCHGTKSLTGLEYVCSNCHRPPTAHQGANDDCAKCHSPAGWKPATISGHKFPQDHNGAAGNCAMCHPQGNTRIVDCYTCHVRTSVETAHSAKGLNKIGSVCATCHPEGRKPG